MQKIDFVNLPVQYPLIKKTILKKFADIIDRSAFTSGKYVEEFENSFAHYVGVKHCVAVNSGTSALQLSILANDIGPGDEVIIPVNSFVATAESVILAGANPVFVDIDAITYNINSNQIEDAITKKTKAIIPVHLFGQCAAMTEILRIARRHKLIVIEDACQAHGARYEHKIAGSFGDCGAFSFYPGKNLGAWGEGGAITTNNSSLAERIRRLRNHGSIQKYKHETIGGNFRMDEFQGAVLSTKLPFLDRWNGRRKKNAELYNKLFAKSAVITPSVHSLFRHVYHIYCVRVPNRDVVMQTLQKKQIATGIHYPIPIHLQPAFKYCNKNIFPVAEQAANEILSLPMFPELTSGAIRYIAKQLLTTLS